MKGLLSHKGSSATNQRPGSRWLTTKSHDKEVAVGLTGNSSRLNLIDFEKKQEIGTMAYNECICLLTGVYYLCEIADSLIMDSLAVFSKEPWFKNGINSNFKNAQKSIRHKIKIFKQQNNQVDVIEDISDSIYEAVMDDLQKMTYGTELELAQQGIEQAKALDSLLCVKIILNLATLQYRQIVSYMHENVLCIPVGGIN